MIQRELPVDRQAQDARREPAGVREPLGVGGSEALYAAITSAATTFIVPITAAALGLEVMRRPATFKSSETPSPSGLSGFMKYVFTRLSAMLPSCDQSLIDWSNFVRKMASV